MLKNKITLLMTLVLMTFLFSCGKKDNLPPADAPHRISAVSPTSGAKGTVITITGSGFDLDAANNIVKFNGVEAEVTNATAISISVIVPAKAKDGSISITINGKTSVGPGFDHIPTYTVSAYVGTTGKGTANGTGTTARFYYPHGLATDSEGNMYVADSWNDKIRKISPEGVVSDFVGSGTIGTADGTGTAASFSGPTGIAIDASGNLYITDTNNSRVRKITPSGEVTTLAGGTPGHLDGTGTAARFSNPRGIAVDPAGNIFVTDMNGHRIRKITPAGVVSTFAGSGTSGSSDGIGTAAEFYGPSAIVRDASGNFYVTDKSNNKIRKITPAGQVTTMAGSGSSGTIDGDGTNASFYGPSGITIDADNNLYVVDSYSDLVRKVTPSGVVTTIAGSSRGDGIGPGLESKFYLPNGITINSSGDLFISDYANHRIKKITIE